jgi:predicted Mrr-cat superfamily restriction endonuclease
MSAEQDREFWRLRAWDDPMLEQQWMERELLAMTEDELGELDSLYSIELATERLQDKIGPLSTASVRARARYVVAFAHEMSYGDLVLVPLCGRRVGLAEILGSYSYNRKEPDPRLRHLRPARWLWTGARDQLPDDIRKVVNAPGTVCRVNKPYAIERMLRVVRGEAVDAA